MAYALYDSVFDVNTDWQKLLQNPDFKEIPGYQVWREHYKNVKPPVPYHVEGLSWIWFGWYYGSAVVDADNATLFRRAQKMNVYAIPSSHSAFKRVPVTRNRKTELGIQENFDWDFVAPQNSLISQWNASVFEFKQVRQSEGIRGEVKEISEWFEAISLESGKAVTTKVEEDHDLKAFKSLLFMTIGRWCPVDEEKMRTASQKLRMACGCPIVKMFNQVYHRKKYRGTETCCNADELDENEAIQLEMLKNKMMTDHIIVFNILPHLGFYAIR